MNLVTNVLPTPTVKEFLKSANISQSYERISSGTFFMAHGVVPRHVASLWRGFMKCMHLHVIGVARGGPRGPSPPPRAGAKKFQS